MKQRGDLEWVHKSLCLYHHIYPIAKQFFNEEVIPEKQWKVCQCGKFNKIISDYKWKYRVGLNEVIKPGIGSTKTAYYTDIKIRINDSIFNVHLLSMQSGEIKKSIQPATRKKILATGYFINNFYIFIL